MSRAPNWLLDFKRDVYSQTGEDGIIEKILEVLPHKDRWCVEFGAWDGKFVNNTRHLIETKDYSSVLIEPVKSRFQDLQRNYTDRKNVITVNKFVGFTASDNLDHILGATPIPVDFDFLSIDIDGNDYHAWKAFTKYKPKFVVIEFNQTIPTPVSFIQPADPAITQGASLLAMVELGKEKGYELVSVLPFNAFFVRKEYYPLFQMETNAPEVLRTDLSDITYLFVGYDGKVFLRGNRKLPWHGHELKESKMQVLPGFLQCHTGNYPLLRKIFYKLYRLIFL